MRTKLKEVLQSTHSIDGDYYALYGIPQSITYGNTVYQKGGQVVHTLRGYMGDSLFFRGIKAYLQKFGYNYASTFDLLDFLTAFSGIDLGPFFDAWVFNPGFPHFSIDSSVIVKSKSGYDVTVFVRQKRKGTIHYANKNHLPITFMDKNWQSITDTIFFSGAGGSKKFHLPFSPVTVMADMDEKISDASTDEFKTIKTIGQFDYPQTFCKLMVENIVDSALVRITHNWVEPDSFNVLRPGFRISDSRYWTVEGIFPSGFKAKGVFTYDKAVGLDKSLFTDSEDSLVMLYRQGAGKPWKETSFNRKGLWGKGTITVDMLQKGEYAFGIRDSDSPGKVKK
jgi:aminopeptidase N